MPSKRPSLQSLLTPSFLSPSTSPTSSDLGATQAANDYLPRARSSSSVEQVLRSHMANRHVTHSSVTSPRSSPPPAFLIDDDPFANLSAVPYTSSSDHIPHSPSSSPTSPQSKAVPTPRSPLTPSSIEINSLSFSRTSPSRTLSGRAKPAHQKPAFSPRPSLPSLHTLAKMNVVFNPKVRF